jgi:hypothetical protein
LLFSQAEQLTIYWRVVAANSARDVGGRLANMTIYGLKATGGKYAVIAALTNIPAMIVAVLLYEFFLTDCDRGKHLASDVDHSFAHERRVQSSPVRTWSSKLSTENTED